MLVTDPLLRLDLAVADVEQKLEKAVADLNARGWKGRAYKDARAELGHGLAAPVLDALPDAVRVLLDKQRSVKFDPARPVEIADVRGEDELDVLEGADLANRLRDMRAELLRLADSGESVRLGDMLRAAAKNKDALTLYALATLPKYRRDDVLSTASVDGADVAAGVPIEGALLRDFNTARSPKGAAEAQKIEREIRETYHKVKNSVLGVRDKLALGPEDHPKLVRWLTQLDVPDYHW